MDGQRHSEYPHHFFLKKCNGIKIISVLSAELAQKVIRLNGQVDGKDKHGKA